VILVSGTLWATRPNPTVTMDILLDTHKIGSCKMWINPQGVHTTLPPVTLTVPQQLGGNHVLELKIESGNTSSDSNDFYNVTVIELK